MRYWRSSSSVRSAEFDSLLFWHSTACYSAILHLLLGCLCVPTAFLLDGWKRWLFPIGSLLLCATVLVHQLMFATCLD